MSMATNHATLTQCEAKPEHDESVLETLLFLQKSPGGTELVLDPANRASVDTARVTTLLSNNRRRVPMQMIPEPYIWNSRLTQPFRRLVNGTPTPLAPGKSGESRTKWYIVLIFMVQTGWT